LLAQAEKLVELKGICDCGRKATHVVRLDGNGKAVTDGAQVVIGFYVCGKQMGEWKEPSGYDDA
jgi:thymidine kinase